MVADRRSLALAFCALALLVPACASDEPLGDTLTPQAAGGNHPGPAAHKKRLLSLPSETELEQEIRKREAEVQPITVPMPKWNPPFAGSVSQNTDEANAALETVSLNWKHLTDGSGKIALPKNLWKETSLDITELSPKELAEDPGSPAPNDQFDGMKKKMEKAPAKQALLKKKAEDIMDVLRADQACQATRALCHKTFEAEFEQGTGGNLDSDALLAKLTTKCAPVVQKCMTNAAKKKRPVCD